MPRPMVASTKVNQIRPGPSGLAKPRVNRDDPLVIQASSIDPTPRPQKMSANPTAMSMDQANGSETRATGAYRPDRRRGSTRCSFGLVKRRSDTANIKRVMPVRPPWGSTTVRSADMRTDPARRLPTATATQSSAFTPPV